MTYMDPRPEGLNTEPAPKSVVETLKPRTWHKGPPPFPGWWMASVRRRTYMWRWWNGLNWSRVAMDEYLAPHAGERAAQAADDNEVDLIEWTDYWPENARVPCVNPNEVKA